MQYQYGCYVEIYSKFSLYILSSLHLFQGIIFQISYFFIFIMICTLRLWSIFYIPGQNKKKYIYINNLLEMEHINLKYLFQRTMYKTPSNTIIYTSQNDSLKCNHICSRCLQDVDKLLYLNYCEFSCNLECLNKMVIF